MRISIIIAAHNEGAVLGKAFLETRFGVRYRRIGSVLLRRVDGFLEPDSPYPLQNVSQPAANESG